MKVRYRGRALADLEDILRYLNDGIPTGARSVIEVLYNAIKFRAK